MTGSLDVHPCFADRTRRWLPTGRDGAWPDHEIDGVQRPARIAQPCAIDMKIGRHIANFELGASLG